MTKLKITIPELSRFSGIPEETIRDAVRSGVVFETLSDASDLEIDMNMARIFKNAMDYRSKHPGAF